jgi:uncharacterized protein YfbU (UPF0304 family)
MELTHAERLILANQFRILQRLESDGMSNGQDMSNRHSPERYEAMAVILERGYTDHYDRCFQDISDTQTTTEQRQVVRKIIGMFATLLTSRDRQIEEGRDVSQLRPDRIEFRGFCGNRETDLRSYAQFLRLILFHSFDCPNSHEPLYEGYREMLARYESIEDLKDKATLSVEEIAAVLG